MPSGRCVSALELLIPAFRIEQSGSLVGDVIPVQSGVVKLSRAMKVFVKVGAARVDQYWHIVPSVRVGQTVAASATVLGHVRRNYGHVHFTDVIHGKAVNPLAVEGPIEGGTAQGLGLALMEELVTRDGEVLNASFTDYLLPTALDMPPVAIELVEVPEPDAPYGVKGVGEPPTVVSTAAIVSALRAATGRPLTRVPVRPDDVCL